MRRTRQWESASHLSTRCRYPEPYVLADPPTYPPDGGDRRAPGPRAWLIAGLVLSVAVAAVVVALLVRGDGKHADLAGRPPARTTPDPAVAASDLLFRLQRGLRSHDHGQVTGLADPAHPASRGRLSEMAANVRALAITRLDLRYVDTSEVTLTPAERDRYGSDAWVADVQVTWRLAGYDPGSSTVDVPVVLGWHGGRAVFETALAAGPGQVPLWLLAHLVVRRT